MRIVFTGRQTPAQEGTQLDRRLNERFSFEPG